MKIRYLIVFLLVCVLGFSIYILIDVRNDNAGLKKKYNEINEVISQNEINKELYLEKEKELAELKDKNIDKIKKYEEVEKWNQEIKEYLD